MLQRLLELTLVLCDQGQSPMPLERVRRRVDRPAERGSCALGLILVQVGEPIRAMGCYAVGFESDRALVPRVSLLVARAALVGGADGEECRVLVGWIDEHRTPQHALE